jgi:O-antigen/teichoic acid export membrane protein
LKEQLKNIFSQTAIYSLGNISTKLVGFVLLPLYTGYLTTAEYGILALLEVISQILIAIFTFNLPIAMLRWIAEVRKAEEEKSIIFTVYFTLIIIALMVLAFGLLFSSQTSDLIFKSHKYASYVKVLFISASLSIINRHPLTLLRHREKAAFFAGANILKLIIILLFNIYFVAYAQIGVIGVVYSLAIGEFFILVITFPFLIKNIFLRIRLIFLKEMFFYGLPLVFAALSGILLTFSDRFILQHFYGPSEVGIYSLGYKIAAVINMFLVQSFSLGYLPFTFKHFEEPESGTLFARVMTYYTAALLISAIIISFYAKELLLLLSQSNNFLIAYKVVPLIAFAFVFRGMQYNFALSFHFSKKTKINAYIIVGTAVFNILANIFLVPKFGFMGSGISMAISFLIMLIITIKPAQSEFFIPFKVKVAKSVLSYPYPTSKGTHFE